jgi:osmotically-inducible protein OsmY
VERVSDIRRRCLPGLAAGLLMLLAGGCSPVGMAVGAGATAGLAVAEERPLGAVASDTAIKLAINEAWFQADLELFENLYTAVSEGRVLVTGELSTPAARVEAVRLVWEVDGVREVINEIEIADSDPSDGIGRDTWIAAQLRTRITFDRSVLAVNYSIDSVDGVVYLMGIAQDEAEVTRVIDHARQIPYVRRIISHVRLKDDPARPS